MDATEIPRLMTPLDVGLWLTLPTEKIIRWARLGKIPCIVLPGGDLLFDPTELRAWLEQRRMGDTCRAD
jgi:hypothetical protein